MFCLASQTILVNKMSEQKENCEDKRKKKNQSIPFLVLFRMMMLSEVDCCKPPPKKLLLNQRTSKYVKWRWNEKKVLKQIIMITEFLLHYFILHDDCTFYNLFYFPHYVKIFFVIEELGKKQWEWLCKSLLVLMFFDEDGCGDFIFCTYHYLII